MSDAANNLGTVLDQSHLSSPAEARIILPVRNTLLFPGIVLPLTIGRPASIAAAQEAARSGGKIGLLLQDDPAVEQPGPEHLRRVGITADVLRYVTSGETHYVICRGLRRFRLVEFLTGFPYLVARITEIGISETITPDIEARMHLLKMRARDALGLLPNPPAEIGPAIDSLDSPTMLAHFIAGIIDIPLRETHDLLQKFYITPPPDHLLGLLAN